MVRSFGAGALLFIACITANPAFDGEASTSSATHGGSGGQGSDSSESAGSGGETGTTASTAGSAGESATGSTSVVTTGETAAGTSSTGEPPTGTSGSGDSTISGGGDMCDAPCDGEAVCHEVDPPVAVNCVDGCAVESPCEPAAICEVLGGAALCLSGDLCMAIDSAYADLVSDPGSVACEEDDDCHVLDGACDLPSGSCWEVLSTGVGQQPLDEFGQSWGDAGCDGDCECDGEAPSAVCDNGVCSAD